MSSALAPVLLAGEWRSPRGAVGSFRAVNPATGEALPDLFPVSSWQEVEQALAAAEQAFDELRQVDASRRADFLDRYAARLEARKAELVRMAHEETGLAIEPRLAGTEMPRTTDQLRQAAAAARAGDWALPTLDLKNNLRSMYVAIGPCVLFGPNNFPFAYNAVAGGDFAAAIAAGNPVVCKGHPSHPGTTRLLAEEALAATQDAGLPPATVQLIYHLEGDAGLRLVADPRVGAVGFTGSRRGGLALKAAADAVGKPIFLEMGSLNPVLLLPGALAERFEEILNLVAGSCLLGMGQFCTNPGLLFLPAGEAGDRFVAGLVERYQSTPTTPLLSQQVQTQLHESVQALQAAGATLRVGGRPLPGPAIRYENTLLTATGQQFLAAGHGLQREAFGNATLVVRFANVEELAAAVRTLEGQLAGSIFSSHGPADDAAYARLEPLLRRKVGRLLNDKMTTGVAVSPAQNHGGPFPATGHPHFTAVGMPATIRRFAMLACFDNVRASRLPPALRG